MADPTLLLLANQVRTKTLRLLSDVTDEQAQFKGHSNLSNSILWHAGHALLTVEHLSVMPATGIGPQYPAGWFDKFAWKSQPAKVTEWPPLAQIVALLNEQLVRLTNAIKDLHPERFDQVIDAERNRTLRFSILHGLHDEAGHQGEIHLLKKLWSKQAL